MPRAISPILIGAFQWLSQLGQPHWMFFLLVRKLGYIQTGVSASLQWLTPCDPEEERQVRMGRFKLWVLLWVFQFCLLLTGCPHAFPGLWWAHLEVQGWLDRHTLVLLGQKSTHVSSAVQLRLLSWILPYFLVLPFLMHSSPGQGLPLDTRKCGMDDEIQVVVVFFFFLILEIV